MHIINIMLSKQLGGIEQAFIDYCEGLQQRGHQITAIIHSAGRMAPNLKKIGCEALLFFPSGQWDILAVWRLRRMLRKVNPHVVIAHGNRAFYFSRKAINKNLRLVAVTHNYRTKAYQKASAVFATTKDLARKVEAQVLAHEKIFLIPNMTRSPEVLPMRKLFCEPPIVIGTIGRLVAKKGFLCFVDALKILHDKGLAFRAVLGGDGPEHSAICSRIIEYNMTGLIDMPGWVEDKHAFF